MFNPFSQDLSYDKFYSSEIIQNIAPLQILSPKTETFFFFIPKSIPKAAPKRRRSYLVKASRDHIPIPNDEQVDASSNPTLVHTPHTRNCKRKEKSSLESDLQSSKKKRTSL